MSSNNLWASRRRRGLSRAFAALGVASLAVLGPVQTSPAGAVTAAMPATGTAGAAASPVVVNGGTVLPGRLPGKTGALGVTFGIAQATVNGGPYVNQDSPIYNVPLYKVVPGDLTSFWDNYVEEMTSAGVDFVAVVLRGYIPGSAVPNGGGDPRLLKGLVDAINRKGVSDKLKIAAFDDTPASLTDKKNLIKHHAGGYVPPFDIGDSDGTGEGGYQYFWDNNEREFFTEVPDSMRFKIDGRPVVYEWSINPFAFTNQGNGNESRLIQYVRSRAQAEFDVDPYFIVDNSWVKNDPSVVSQIDGVNNWFTLPTGYTEATYQPIANDDLLSYDAGWSKGTVHNVGDYSDDIHTTTTVGAAVQYGFYGTGVQYLAETNADDGDVDVYIDGQFQANVRLDTSSTLMAQQVVYQKSGLTNGFHTIKVVNKSTSVVNVDGFRVLSDQPAAVAGRSYGVATPGFRYVNGTSNMVMDPNHGQKLNQTLDATVNAGAVATLVEGMTDWPENAMVARTADGSYDQRLTDYPGQMIDIMRQYSRDPFPQTLRVEAETADTYSGATPGNRWGVYRDGDLDVQPTTDAGGGWNVGDIAAGESLTWKSKPLQGTVTLSARVATPNNGAQVRFIVDGQAGPVVSVPNTGNWQTYTTVEAGTFQFAAGTHHTVTLEFPAGSLNANYWTATTVSPPPAPTPAGPSGQIIGMGGKCADLAGGSGADNTPVVLNTCATSDTQQWTAAANGTIQVLGKCMTPAGDGTTNGTRVVLRWCDGSPSQQWQSSTNGHVVNTKSGICLDTSNASTAGGNPLIIYACNGGDQGQVWTLPSVASGPVGQITGFNGRCVDLASGSGADGTQVQLNTCGDADSQKWTVASDGTVRSLGKCMGLAGGGTANGTRVQLSPCSGSDSQRWRVGGVNNTFVNVLSGRCLDATGISSAVGTPLQIWDCGGGDNQIWGLPSASPTGSITGYGAKCVDVAGGATANGTKIQLFTCNSTSAQRWTVAPDGSLQALGKCMTVAGGGTANGTKVQLSTCTNNASQKWQAGSNSALVNPQSGRCLDATGPSSADGTPLQIWSCAGSDNQKWNLPNAS
jgi:hypothetical protein